MSSMPDKPLEGKRVLVTRPRGQAGSLSAHLAILGAEVVLLPAIEIREPADWSKADQALGAVSSYAWIVFTSANGVHAFMKRLKDLGHDQGALHSAQFAVMGPGTADALRSYQLQADVVPSEYRSEGLVEALAERAAGKSVLLVRADRGREILTQELGKTARVTQIVVYSQVDALDSTSPAMASLRRGDIDYVTLTSSSIARAFIEALDDSARLPIKSGRTGIVTISPVTSEAVRKLGLDIAGEASVYTMEGLAAALVALARGAVSANREGRSSSGSQAR
jgi:uroporphyrinogen III methyltransferase/synthase